MNRDIINQVIQELGEFGEQKEQAFEIWFNQMADGESIKSFAKAGWMLYQLKVELDDAEDSNPATD